MPEHAFEPLAEDALLLRFGCSIDPAINARVHAAAHALGAANLPGILDIAPAYATLLVRFDALAWTDHGQERPFARIAAAIAAAIADRAGASQDAVPAPSRAPAPVRDIPVCYGGEHGPDLEAVARHAGLPPAEIIARHAAAEYRVAMLGFAPGFPYLLGLDPALHMPRRGDPRTRVPAGSIAIGGAQTGIYPRELPGGWHLIGRTPCAIFDPTRRPPALLAPGDRVGLRVIDAARFAQLAETGT